MHIDNTLPSKEKSSARSSKLSLFTEFEGNNLINNTKINEPFTNNVCSPLILKDSSLPGFSKRRSRFFEARQSDNSLKIAVENTESKNLDDSSEFQEFLKGLAGIPEDIIHSDNAIAKGVKEDKNNLLNSSSSIKPWQRLKNDLTATPSKNLIIDNNNNTVTSSPSVFTKKDDTKPKQVTCTCSTTTSVVKGKNLENQDLCIACTFSQEVDRPVDPTAKLNKNPHYSDSNTADIKLGNEDLDSLTDWLDTLEISQKATSTAPLKSEEVDDLSELLRDVKLEATVSPAKEQDKRTSGYSKNSIKIPNIKREKLQLASTKVSERAAPSIIKLESRYKTLDEGPYFSFGGEITNEKEKDDALLDSYPRYTQPSYQHPLTSQKSPYINRIQEPDRHHFSIKQPSFQTPHLQNAFSYKQPQRYGKSHHQSISYNDTSSHYQSHPFALPQPFNMQARSNNNCATYQPYLISEPVISEIPPPPLSSYSYAIRQNEANTAYSSRNEDLGNVNKTSEDIINACHQTPATKTSKQPYYSLKQSLSPKVYDSNYIDTHLKSPHYQENNFSTRFQRDNAEASDDDLPILLEILSQRSLSNQQSYDSSNQFKSSSTYNQSSSYSDYSKANDDSFIHELGQLDSSLDNSSSNSNVSGQSPANASEDELIPNYTTPTYNPFDILQLADNSGFLKYAGLLPIDNKPQKLQNADPSFLKFMAHPDKIATNDDILRDLYTTMVLPEHMRNFSETGSNNKLPKPKNSYTEGRLENSEKQRETVNVPQKEHSLNTNFELEHLLNFDPISTNTRPLGPDALRKELALEDYVSFPSETNPDFDKSTTSGQINLYNFVEFNPSKITAADSSKTREGRITKSNRTECSLCKKSMLKKNLSSHLKTHNENRKKDNVCGICGSSYFYLKDLTRHTRLEHR